MERLRILLNQMVSEKTADVFLNEIRHRPPVLLVKLVQERESLNSLLNQIGISPGLDRVGVITALEIWSKEYVKKEQGPLAIEKEEKQRSMAIIEKEEEQGPLAIEKEEEQGSMAIIEKEEEKSLGTDEKTIKQWTVDEVVQWALKIDGIEQEDTEALRTQRVSGKALLNLNAASLERCGIHIGPAAILAKEIENLKGPTQTDLPDFDPTTDYNFQFPSFESNGDYFPLLNRQKEVNLVRKASINLQKTEKYEPIIIATSRGMGKTFFMKRLVKGEIVGTHPVKAIQNAYMVGRVATMESLEIVSFVTETNFLYQHFWQITIILNLTQIFKGRKVDGINFVSLTITEIVSCLNKSNTPLQRWICKLLSCRTGDAFEEMVRITNLAFKQNSSVPPVFLIDNIHNLAQIETRIPSKMKGLYHTLLSLIVTQLAENRVLAIFAGTTAGNIDLVAEYSNFKPKYIYLKRLRVKDAYLCYTKLCEKENQEQGQQIIPVKDNNPLFLAMTYSKAGK
jgi:hypothetical protein